MFTVVVTTPDGIVRELTPVQNSMRFTTAAVGGFASASFSMEGDRRTSVPFFATVRVLVGTDVAWEGRVEDVVLNLNDPVTTDVSCFGFQRLLTDTSVRRIWSKRDMTYNDPTVPAGGALATLVRAADTGMTVNTGQIDRSDLTKLGVQIAGAGVAVPTLNATSTEYYPPTGLTIVQILYSFILSGANTGSGKMEGFHHELSAAGAALAGPALTASNANAGGTCAANTAGIRFGMFNAAAGATTPTATDLAQFYNIRVLGTSLSEDIAGGFYGGTIVKDLLALIPALGQGIIEQGSDFTIPSIERSVRDTIASVVAEVATYYAREWAVWDSPLGVPVFSWTTPNLDEPQWIVTLDKLLAGSKIESSIDQLFKTEYVLYTLAGDVNNTTSEQSASSTDQRNPAVKTGATKDQIVQAPAVMTDNTASALAALEAAKQLYAPASGTVVLRANDPITNAVGSPKPAALIRAGSNIFLPDLVRSDSLLAPPQRDGQTLFHIASTEVDMEAGTVTLELEGQAREIDVITARLAAATRVVTG